MTKRKRIPSTDLASSILGTNTVIDDSQVDDPNRDVKDPTTEQGSTDIALAEQPVIDDPVHIPESKTAISKPVPVRKPRQSSSNSENIATTDKSKPAMKDKAKADEISTETTEAADTAADGKKREGAASEPELYSKRTYLISNKVIEAIDAYAYFEKTEKSAIVNDALRSYLGKYYDKDAKP